MGLPVVSMKIVIANVDVDVGGTARSLFVLPDNATQTPSLKNNPGTVRVAAGTYEVDVRINDGAVNRIF